MAAQWQHATLEGPRIPGSDIGRPWSFQGWVQGKHQGLACAQRVGPLRTRSVSFLAADWAGRVWNVREQGRVQGQPQSGGGVAGCDSSLGSINAGWAGKLVKAQKRADYGGAYPSLYAAAAHPNDPTASCSARFEVIGWRLVTSPAVHFTASTRYHRHSRGSTRAGARRHDHHLRGACQRRTHRESKT